MNPVDFAEALRSCTENGADPEILFGAAEEIDRLRLQEKHNIEAWQRENKSVERLALLARGQCAVIEYVS